MPGSTGAEVVLIEFIGDAKSAVAAGEETVAVLDQVAVAADRAGQAQIAQGQAATTAAKESKTAAASSAAASKKQTVAIEETTAATDAQAAAQRKAAAASKTAAASAMGQSVAWKRNTAAIGAVGSGLTKFVTIPMLAVGAVATKMSLDFSKAMLLIETHTDTSRKMVDRYRKSILAMSASGKYTQGPKELADAMYHVASDGYKGSKALDILRQSAHLATLGQSDLAETTYALVSVMKTGIKGTNDMHEAIGTLNAIVGAGDMKMQDLVGAMSTGIMPAAKGVGLSLKDVGAALDVMTQRGVPAQQAAYRLSMNFQQLVPYTTKAQGAFEQLGLGQDELAKKVKGPTGFLDALKLLQSHLSKFGKYEQGTLIRDMFGGGRTSRGMLMLLQNLKGMEESYEHINSLQGKTNKNLQTALKSPANVWAEEWAKLKTTMTELGDELVPVLIPALKDIAGAIKGIAGVFNSLPGDSKKWVIELAFAAAALGPILKMVSGIGGMVTKIGATSLFSGAAGAAGAAEGGAAAATGAGVAASTVGAEAGAGGAAVGAAGLGLGAMATPFGAALALDLMVAQTEKSTSAFEDAHKSYEKTAKGLNDKNVPAWKRAAEAVKAAGKEAHVAKGNLEAIPTAGGRVGAPPAAYLLHGEHAQSHTDIKAAMKPVEEAEARYGSLITKIEFGAVTGLSHMNENLKKGLHEASEAWKTGTEPWRKHTVAAMEAAVTAIKSGIKQGTIDAGRGGKEISRLLDQIHIAKGSDPFGVAEGAMASFKKANSVTQSGVDELIRDLRRMPPKAREQAQDSILGMAQAWAQGHPKIEKEVDGLRHNLTSKFGKTNKVLIHGVEGAVGAIGGLFGSLGDTVSQALEALGVNVSAVLKAFGIGKDIHFALKTGGSAASAVGSLGSSLQGFLGGESEGKAGGGFLGGAGLRDTVPIMAAPGEAILNRHQQAPVEHALRSTYGFGLSGLFQKEQTPHYMAKGGLVEPHMVGAEPLRSAGQGAIHEAYGAAKKYIAKHRPKKGLGGANVPTGPIQRMAREMVSNIWGSGQFGAFNSLEMQEAGWNPRAENPSSGAAGLAQALPASKYPPGAWPYKGLSSAKIQLQWMMGYIKERYGSPAGAWAHEQSAGWYAKGGFILPDRDAPKAERDQIKQLREMGVLQYAAKGKEPEKATKGSTTKPPPPSALEQMIARMKQLDAWHIPYREEHVGFSEHPAFLDCSAAVSDVLHAGGLLDKEEVSGELASYGKSGTGKVTIFANAGHAFMNVLGRYFGTSSSNPSGGPGFIAASNFGAGYLSTFSKRHPPDGALGSGVSGSTVTTPVPKQVQGPFVKSKAGDTTAGGGTLAEDVKSHYKAQTAALSFGSVPSSLQGIQKELALLRNRTLPEYQAAVRHTKDPKTKHALEVNVKAIKARIRELVRARAKLMAEKRRAEAKKAIEKRGVFPDLDKHLAMMETKQAGQAEYAEQVTALEPEDLSKTGIGYAAILQSYIDHQEGPAWGSVLDSEASWRNAILKGEGTVTTRVEALEKQLAAIEKLKGTDAYKKQKFRIGPLKTSIASAKAVFDPATGTGSLEEELVNVQGHFGVRDLLASLPSTPEAGTFGGMIWDTQMTISELGLKIREAKKAEEEGNEPEENTGLAAAVKALAEVGQRERALEQFQLGPFQEFLKAMPPYIGAFKSGGFVPGSVNQAYTATVHGGETIVPAGGAGATMGPIEFHLRGDIAQMLEIAAPGLTKKLEQSMGANYRRIVFSPAAGGR